MTAKTQSGRKRSAGLALITAVMMSGFISVTAARSEGAQSDRERRAIELNNLGVAAMNSGDFKNSIRLLNEARDILPGDSQITRNLSMTMNNLAVYYLSDTKPDLAISWLNRALRLNPEPMFRQNLAQADVMKGRIEEDAGRPELAQQIFRDAILQNPQDPESHAALGLSLYQSGKLPESQTELERALSLASRPDWAARAEKIRREIETEKNNIEYRSVHFRISYSPAISAKDISDAAWELEQAYQKFRMFLGGAPQTDISVVFYSSKEKFATTHDLTYNVAGLYDGKVRLPIPDNPNWETLRNTLSHELAHAFLFDIAGEAIPAWINEGFAEFLGAGADRSTPSLDETVRLNRKFIPLSELSVSVKNLKNNTQVSLAYDESFSIAKYINSRFGLFGIQKLLQAIKRGLPEEQAIQQSLLMSPDMIQQAWEFQVRK